jgi:tetratricopeptide (TPR) repeat protein
MIRLLLATISVLLMSQAAHADMVDDCNQDADKQLKIRGCSRIIDSGDWTGRDLGIVYHNRGSAQHDLENYDQAIRDYSRAINLMPDDSGPLIDRGVAYKNSGRFEEAVRDHGRAIQIDPENYRPYMGRGAALAAMDRISQANASWNKGLRIGGSEVVKLYQEWIQYKGHYKGNVDGNDDKELRDALVACARDPSC